MLRLVIRIVFAVGFVATATACDPFDCDLRDELVIEDRTLPQARVGQAYDELLVDHFFNAVEPAGGAALPPGLEIEDVQGRFHLRGTPTGPGQFSTRLLAVEHGTQCNGRAAEFDVSITVLSE